MKLPLMHHGLRLWNFLKVGFFFPTYVLIFSVLMRGILRLRRPHSPEINIVHSSCNNSYLLLSSQPIIGELSWEGLGWWVLNGYLPYELTQDGTVLLHIVHEVGWLFIDLKTKVIWNICQGTKTINQVYMKTRRQEKVSLA